MSVESGMQIVFVLIFAKLVFPTYDNPLGSTLQGMGGYPNMRFRMPIWGGVVSLVWWPRVNMQLTRPIIRSSRLRVWRIMTNDDVGQCFHAPLLPSFLTSTSRYGCVCEGPPSVDVGHWMLLYGCVCEGPPFQCSQTWLGTIRFVDPNMFPHCVEQSILFYSKSD